MVPKSQYAKALVREPSIASNIALIFGMLTAIGLDDQAMRVANEVGDVAIIKVNLMTPFETIKAFRAKNSPQLSFGLSRRAAHGLRACPHELFASGGFGDGFVAAIAACPSPSPAFGAGSSLPRKGGGVGVGRHRGDADEGDALPAQATNPSGFSTSALNAFICLAPSAPSIARWSKLPVALITVAT